MAEYYSIESVMYEIYYLLFTGFPVLMGVLKEEREDFEMV